MNGFVNLNPVSANGLFHYQITTSTEITNRNLGCKLKLCKLNEKLIYYNLKTQSQFEFEAKKFSEERFIQNLDLRLNAAIKSVILGTKPVDSNKIEPEVKEVESHATKVNIQILK